MPEPTGTVLELEEIISRYTTDFIFFDIVFFAILLAAVFIQITSAVETEASVFFILTRCSV